MANKYYGHDNLAHEFEMPYEDEGRAYENTREYSRRNSVRTEPAMSLKEKAMWGILTIIALTLLASLIYGRVEISRLYSERAGLEKQLAVIQNANISMQSEIAERMNMTKVEEYAKDNLGLQKLDKSQIEYIEVETPSTVEVKQEKEEGIFVRIKQLFNSASEYLGL